MRLLHALVESLDSLDAGLRVAITVKLAVVSVVLLAGRLSWVLVQAALAR